LTAWVHDAFCTAIAITGKGLDPLVRQGSMMQSKTWAHNTVLGTRLATAPEQQKWDEAVRVIPPALELRSKAGQLVDKVGFDR
jgi:hypothetical protein